MAQVLTNGMIEQMGEERVRRICAELGAQVSPRVAPPPSGLVRDLCRENVEQFVHLIALGVPMPNVIAAVTTSSIRLGYALYGEELERDRALVKALTEDEG